MMKKTATLASATEEQHLPPLAFPDFTLPPALEAGEPPEARGLARDEVRLLVSTVSTDQTTHTRFRQIEDFLDPGDVLVINTSGTLNAAIPVRSADGTPLELHLSTHLPAHLWVVEIRAYADASRHTTRPCSTLQPGESLQLPAGGNATLHTPYAPEQSRLWVASLTLPTPLHTYLEQHGFPIRYSYVKQSWPPSYYQTVYVTEPGSAEMPSAGRAFTPELLTRLVARGMQIAPLLLHTGVASQERQEPVYEEYYRVPASTANIVNFARQRQQRIIAIGTTVVRALETVTDSHGTTYPGSGWTDVVITPQRGIRAVNGLLTGLHEPRSSHLAMLEALAGQRHLEIAYRAALTEGYLWHEFGDLHLILP